LPIETVAILCGLILMLAALYGSVGHAGASGYLAAMALMGIEPDVMKPTALCLNIFVAFVVTFKYYRAGFFSWVLFWPFAVASFPMAYVGGLIQLPGDYYKPLVGVVLLVAATKLIVAPGGATVAATRPPRLPLALALGATIGLLSGLTGTGGGIFLSPVLVFLGWSDVRRAGGVSAAFILVNSVSGLAGVLHHTQSLPRAIPLWALAAVLGGFLGSHYGTRRFGNTTLRRLLGLVLVIAGLKLIVRL
jgi:hypothetical protein